MARAGRNNAACRGVVGLFAGDRLHTGAAELYRPALQRLRRQTDQPVCRRVPGLHEGQRRDLQYLVPAAGRELAAFTNGLATFT